MQWSQGNWSPHSSAFCCLCWGNQPLLAVQTSRGVCFSCCFSTQKNSLCDLLSFWRLCQCEGDWWTGTSHFSASDALPTCSGLPQLSTLLLQQQVAHHWVRTALCSWNIFICFALLFFTPFSHTLSPHTYMVFHCWRSYCALCSPWSRCSSRAVVMLRSGGSSGSADH